MAPKNCSRENKNKPKKKGEQLKNCKSGGSAKVSHLGRERESETEAGLASGVQETSETGREEWMSICGRQTI